MATVTVKKAPTPSEEIITEENKVIVVDDARKRKIGIRKVNMSMRRRLFKALSAENQAKPQYLGIAMLAICVTEIDGDPVSFPTTELQVDFLIDRLEDDGIAAVALGLQKHFGIGKTDEELAEEAKN